VACRNHIIFEETSPKYGEFNDFVDLVRYMITHQTFSAVILLVVKS